MVVYLQVLNLKLKWRKRTLTMKKTLVHVQGALVLVDKKSRNPKNISKYRLISKSLSKFVEVYEK